MVGSPVSLNLIGQISVRVSGDMPSYWTTLRDVKLVTIWCVTTQQISCYIHTKSISSLFLENMVDQVLKESISERKLLV